MTEAALKDVREDEKYFSDPRTFTTTRALREFINKSPFPLVQITMAGQDFKNGLAEEVLRMRSKFTWEGTNPKHGNHRVALKLFEVKNYKENFKELEKENNQLRSNNLFW